MKRNQPERTFKYRLKAIFEENDWSFIIIPMQKYREQIIDAFAICGMRVIPIEVKGRRTNYPDWQRKMQIEFFNRTETPFFVIKQRGKSKIEIYCPNKGKVPMTYYVSAMKNLEEIFYRWLYRGKHKPKTRLDRKV